MELNKKVLYIGLILTILVSLIYSQEEDIILNQESSNIIYESFCLIYEFHTDYVEIIDMGEFVCNTEIPFFPCSGVSLYSAKDFYNVKVSDNIKKCSINSEKQYWRGATYEMIGFLLSFGDTIKPHTKCSFVVSYETKRLPHLHTKEPIQKNKTLYMTVNIEPKLFIKNHYRIIAIPKSSEYKGDTAYKPVCIKELEDWCLIIYDVSLFTTNISVHPTFTIFDDAPDLDIYKVYEKVTGKKTKKFNLVSIDKIKKTKSIGEMFYEYFK